MSITNSMYIGVSGLDAHGDAISVVGDNIANASTIGYKAQRAEFADLLGGQLGAQRLGGGVRLAGTDTLFNQGALQQTGAPLDLAIRGKGFFAVKGSHDGQNATFLTRDGRFHLDSDGYVTNTSGLRLQGYQIDASGTRAVAPGDLPIGARQSPPVATTKSTIAVQLDANATAPAAPWNLADPVNTSNYATSQTVYDSLGNTHHVDLYFRKNGTGWDVHAVSDVGGTPTEIATGSLSFNSSGLLNTQTMTPVPVTWPPSTTPQSIAFSFGDPLTGGGTGAGSTSTAGASAVLSTTADGRAAGSLTDIQVTSDGKIRGSFDNGDTIDLAQVALADVPNEQGLVRSGDGLFSASTASGQPLMDAAATGGRGAISEGALEASNVDLGNELVTLIAYQRAFQANAKTVTTADEMMTDVTNLKR